MHPLVGEVLDCKALPFCLLALGLIKHAKGIAARSHQSLGLNGLVNPDAAGALGVVGIGSACIRICQPYRRIHQGGLDIVYAPVGMSLCQEGGGSGHMGRRHAGPLVNCIAVGSRRVVGGHSADDVHPGGADVRLDHPGGHHRASGREISYALHTAQIIHGKGDLVVADNHFLIHGHPIQSRHFKGGDDHAANGGTDFTGGIVEDYCGNSACSGGIGCLVQESIGSPLDQGDFARQIQAGNIIDPSQASIDKFILIAV